MSTLGHPLCNHIRRLFGSAPERRLARAALKVKSVRRCEAEFDKRSDAELLAFAKTLRGRARGGERLDRLVPEAFGLVCVAARRQIGLRPYDVQIAAGAVLLEGGLAELATGEGKTLAASLPAFLQGLTAKGVHVTTVNDYLARRDAEWMLDKPSTKNQKAKNQTSTNHQEPRLRECERRFVVGAWCLSGSCVLDAWDFGFRAWPASSASTSSATG